MHAVVKTLFHRWGRELDTMYLLGLLSRVIDVSPPHPLKPHSQQDGSFMDDAPQPDRTAAELHTERLQGQSSVSTRP